VIIQETNKYRPFGLYIFLKELFMKKKNFWFGILALMLVFTMTAVGCGDDSTDDKGGGGGKIDYNTNSIDDLAAWLAKQPVNSASTPYTVKMQVNDLTDFGVLRETLNMAGRYVYLDLSGSPLTAIPSSAFCSCLALVGITIPNSVTNILRDAFNGCTSLKSATGLIA